MNKMFICNNDIEVSYFKRKYCKNDTIIPQVEFDTNHQIALFLDDGFVSWCHMSCNICPGECKSYKKIYIKHDIREDKLKNICK